MMGVSLVGKESINTILKVQSNKQLFFFLESGKDQIYM